MYISRKNRTSYKIILLCIFAFIFLSCISLAARNLENSIIGVWQGKLGDNENSMEVIWEFRSDNTVSCFMKDFTLILNASYEYNPELQTVNLVLDSYKSFGSNIELHGSPFQEDAGMLNFIDVNIQGDILIMSKSDPGDGTIEAKSFTKADRFPAKKEDINATVINLEILGASEIAGRYILVFAVQADSDENSGPMALSFGKISPDGTAKLGLFIGADKFRGNNSIELIILGGDIIPEQVNLSASGPPFNNLICFAAWNGSDKPVPILVEKEQNLEVVMDFSLAASADTLNQ